MCGEGRPCRSRLYTERIKSKRFLTEILMPGGSHPSAGHFQSVYGGQNARAMLQILQTHAECVIIAVHQCEPSSFLFTLQVLPHLWVMILLMWQSKKCSHSP